VGPLLEEHPTLRGREAAVTVATERGWHEGHRPVCAGCLNPIGVRGEAGVAVLTALVLEGVWEGGTWLAHFQCRRDEWWLAKSTKDPTVRVLSERTYRLLSDQIGYWLKDPQVAWTGRQT
jgi:hypothetical protein